jgi:hypothetical protein
MTGAGRRARGLVLAATLVCTGGACSKTSRAGGDDAAPAAARVEPASDAAGLPVSNPERERAVLRRVQVKTVDATHGPSVALDPRLLGQRLGGQLGASGVFAAEGETVEAPREARPAVLDVVVGYDVMSEGSEGGPAVIAMVEATLEWQDRRGGLRPAMRVLAERSVRGDARAKWPGIILGHVERALADAGAGLIEKESLRTGPAAPVIAALAHEDLDVRVWALAVVADRRLAEAYDTVVGRLASELEEERDAVIGALVGLGDPRGVAALTRHVDFHDYASMRRILDAVAAIGGDEAVAYLEFVASGHPDAEIRQQAQQARERLRRRVQ